MSLSRFVDGQSLVEQATKLHDQDSEVDHG